MNNLDQQHINQIIEMIKLQESTKNKKLKNKLKTKLSEEPEDVLKCAYARIYAYMPQMQTGEGENK